MEIFVHQVFNNQSNTCSRYKREGKLNKVIPPLQTVIFVLIGSYNYKTYKVSPCVYIQTSLSFSSAGA
jgi:hypothetical protein